MDNDEATGVAFRLFKLEDCRSGEEPGEVVGVGVCGCRIVGSWAAEDYPC